MNTRRYPRTLVEAYGPYGDRGPIVDPSERDASTAWWLAISVVCTAAAVVIALVLP